MAQGTRPLAPRLPQEARPPSRRTRAPALCVGALLFASGPLWAQDVELFANPTRWRLSLEQVNPEGPGEALLLGLHYDILEPFRGLPGAYLGFGGLGAVQGDRGGLFAAGATLGWRRALSEKYSIDAGLFVGGGGGDADDPDSGDDADDPDSGDWDGGLFLRPHIAAERTIGDRLGLRLELSHTEVPGGGLSSTQVGLGITRLHEVITSNASIFDLRPLARGTLVPSQEALTVGALYLDPSSGSKRRDGSRLGRRIVLGTAGVELPLEDGWFVPLELAGAGAGGVAGYAQAMAGIARRGPWFEGVERVLDWQWRLMTGAAGGGGVDTGGGLLVSAQGGFESFLTRNWSLRLMGGYFLAPDGEFDGVSAALAASWAPRAAVLPEDFQRERLAREGLFARDYDLDDWTVQLLHKSYFLASTVRDTSGVPLEDDVHLIGAGVTKEIYDALFFSLRGFSAWDGEVGGYREGQVGLRYDLDVLRTVRAGDFYVQYHAGAVGGGGADVGSGVAHEFAAGWRYQVRPSFGMGLEFGKLKADRGSFEAQSIAVTFSWSLTRPLLR